VAQNQWRGGSTWVNSMAPWSTICNILLTIIIVHLRASQKLVFERIILDEENAVAIAA
jgi:hypothetical protein